MVKRLMKTETDARATYRLLPIHRSDSRVSSRSNPSFDRTALLLGLYLFHHKLMAQWKDERAMLPYCHWLLYFYRWSSALHVYPQHWRTLFRKSLARFDTKQKLTCAPY